VAALTGGDDFVDRLRSAGATVYLLGKKGKFDLTVPGRIKRIIEEESVDICHFHNPSPSLWGIVSLKLSGKRIPVVRTEHSPFNKETLPLYLKAAYPFIIRNTDRTICVSDNVRASFLRSFPRFREQFITIHNGIRTGDFDEVKDRGKCRLELGIPTDVPVIGTVGRLVPAKNHKLLIRAFKRLADAPGEPHLAIAGSGPGKEEILRLSKKLSIEERVHVLENIEDIGKVYGAIDVFVLSSDTEGLSLAMLEAMCSGVPVVTTDAGGAPEIIEDGVNGFIVPRGDEESLASRIAELLQNYDLRKEMGAAARETAGKSFDISRTAEAYIELYNELASPARR